MYRIYSDDTLFYDSGLQDDNNYVLTNTKLTMELNKAGSLEFIMPTSNRMYDGLEKLKSTIHVYDDSGIEIWRGRVLHDEKDFYNRKQVYCEGALAFLCDGVQRPYSYTGSVQRYLQMLLGTQTNEVDANRAIRYSLDSSDPVEDENATIVRSNSDYVSTMSEISEKLINSIGGYLRLRFGKGNQIDAIYCEYVNNYGDISDQVIRFGENLLDISEFITAENVFTVLIPLGTKQETDDGTEGARLTIESVNSGLDYIENTIASSLFGRIWRCEYWDDVTIAGNLLTKGRSFLDQNIAMSVTLSIKAVDLHYIDVNTDRFKRGDQSRVISEPHGLDAYFLCRKVVLDFADPSNDEYTLGAGFFGMTDQQIANQKRASEAYYTAASASNAVANISTNVSGKYVTSSELSAYKAQVADKISHLEGEIVKELPSVTTEDDGKVLMVTNGAWCAETLIDADQTGY